LPTADPLTQRLDIHDKTAWMLRSLLEDRSLVAEGGGVLAVAATLCSTGPDPPR